MEVYRIVDPIRYRLRILRDLGAMVFDIVTTNPLSSHGDHFLDRYDPFEEELHEVIEQPSLFEE